MSRFEDLLKGGDLRSIGKADEAARQVNDQQAFDELFGELYNPDRKVAMRAADAVEKITVHKPGYLQRNKEAILALCKEAKDIEIKWHLALLASRLDLTKKEAENTWAALARWAADKKESRIVRVNSLQGLYNILQKNRELLHDFNRILQEAEEENIPSLKARIRKLKNAAHPQ